MGSTNIFDALEYFEVAEIVDDIIDTLHPGNVAHLSNSIPDTPNFELLLPLFGWTTDDPL
jgi:hypothetical protein